MDKRPKDELAGRAILALAAISSLSLIAGVVVAAFGGNVGAVVAIATGAVGGIVAIVLQIARSNGGTE